MARCRASRSKPDLAKEVILVILDFHAYRMRTTAKNDFLLDAHDGEVPITRTYLSSRILPGLFQGDLSDSTENGMNKPDLADAPLGLSGRSEDLVRSLTH